MLTPAFFHRHPSLCLIILGVIGGIACFAPYHWVPLLFITFYGFQKFADHSAHSPFKLGLSFFFGFYGANLYWLTYPLLFVETNYRPLAPLAFAIPFYAAIYGAFSLHVASKIFAHSNFYKWMTWAVLFAMGEWIRGHIFTGFPWNFMGHIWAPWPVLCQITAYGGIYLLSALTIIMLASLAYHPVRISLCLFLTIWGLGAWRLHTQTPSGYQPNITARLVQPHIDQHHKWDQNQQHLNTLLSLSNEPFQHMGSHITTNLPSVVHLPEITPKAFGDKPTHIIWPETAVSYYLHKAPRCCDYLSYYLPEDTWLITGALRSDPNHIYNSLYILDNHGTIHNTYDKSRLLIFGEWVPTWLPFAKLVYGAENYTPGKGLTVFDAHHPARSSWALSNPSVTGFTPLICYESTFPDPNLPAGTTWAINITNDAWFLNSPGPYQHFQITRFRAIEWGVPLVRVANTGISGLINAMGQTQRSLPLGSQGYIDTPIPNPLSHTTLYRQWGDYPYFFVLFLMALWITWQWLARKVT
jgi:apolipoprotein N-acyltransferase